MPDLRRRAADHRHLLTGSVVLVLSAGAQALGGMVFWLIAARGDTADDVGRASALFTSALFVTYLAGLGLPVALARYAPDRGRDSQVVTGWSLFATAAAGFTVALGYLAVVRTEATEALSDWHAVGGPVLFALLVAGAGWSLLVDVRWMTMRRWGLVLARSLFAGLGRLPLLLFAVDGSRDVFLFIVALVPGALSGVVGVVTLRAVTGDRPRLRPAPSTARDAARFAVVNWLSTLAYQGPQFALPVIVLVNVESDTNASFYVAWGITSVAMYVPFAIGQALLAEGGKDGAHLRAQVRIALLLAVTLMAAGALVVGAGRELVVDVYGDDYRAAARVLPGLVAATVPWAITSVYLTEARVRHRHGATVLITTTLTVVTLALALALVPDHGLSGARDAFIAGNIAAAVVGVAAHLTGRDAEPHDAGESLPEVVAAIEAPA